MRSAILSLLPWALVAGCQSPSDCAALGPASGLALHAALLRVEVFPPPARCIGGKVDTGGVVPLFTLAAAPSMLPPISLPAGVVIVHMLAFSDTAATAQLGEGCSSAAIRAGESSCLALPILTSGGNPDGGCQPVTHGNGTGQTYSDCAPTGAVDARLAHLACTAATGDDSLCRDLNCSGGSSGRAICWQGGHCTCWTFTGPGSGLVHISSGGGCDCGQAGDASWN